MVVINTEVCKELKCFTFSICGEEANNSPDCFSKEKKKLAVYAPNSVPCNFSLLGTRWSQGALEGSSNEMVNYCYQPSDCAQNRFKGNYFFKICKLARYLSPYIMTFILHLSSALLAILFSKWKALHLSLSVSQRGAVCSVTQSCPTLAAPGTAAHQAPLSKEFSRQEYWSGLPFPSPGDLPDLEIKPTAPMSPELAGGFFTTALPEKPVYIHIYIFK